MNRYHADALLTPSHTQALARLHLIPLARSGIGLRLTDQPAPSKFVAKLMPLTHQRGTRPPFVGKVDIEALNQRECFLRIMPRVAPAVLIGRLVGQTEETASLSTCFPTGSIAFPRLSMIRQGTFEGERRHACVFDSEIGNP